MAVIKTNGGYNALPISYKRGNPIPLDKSSVWYDYDQMAVYAASDGTAYVGQILSLVNAENASARAYIILNEAGDLGLLGSGSVSSPDVEDIRLELQDVVADIGSILDQIGAPADEETGAAATGIYAEIDNKIASAVANSAHLKRKVVEAYEDIENYIDSHDDADQYIFMVPLGVNDYDNKYEEYVVIEGNIEPVGSWSVDLDDYVKKDELLFTAVDGSHFTINENTLSLKPITMESIPGLIELNSSVGTLTTEVGNLKTKQVNLESRVGNLETLTQSYAGELTAVNGKITALEEALEALNDNFVSIEDFNKAVGNIDELLLNDVNLSAQISDIKLRLTWQTLQ